jgi:hypothetical protein
MAMEMSISNLLQFIAALSPIFLTLCIFMVSLFTDGGIKGLVYLGGILIASLANLLLLNTFKVKLDVPIPTFCNLIDFPFDLNTYIVPAFNSMLISFTLAYLWMPMILISTINYPLIIFIFALLGIDGISKKMNGCNTAVGVLTGTIVGFGLGILYFIPFYHKSPELLFFNNEPSNNVICSRPKKQSFKCQVFKNGELVANT